MASQETITPAITNIAEAVNQTLNLLGAKNDTSRFVGLALLKSLLDNHEELRHDTEVTSKCWDAVPARFLDRLLRASDNKQKLDAEAQSMVDLAVQVIHTFTLLKSSNAGDDEKLVGRTSRLISVLRSW